MIKELTGTGLLIEAKPINDSEYREALLKFTEEEIEKLEKFLYSKIEYAQFSITTKFPDPWPKELSIIYNKFDYDLSKEFLGKFVRNLLCKDDRKWFMTKTKLPQHKDRDYGTNFYAPASF